MAVPEDPTPLKEESVDQTEAAARSEALERMASGEVPAAVFDRFDDAVHSAAYKADVYAHEPIELDTEGKFAAAKDNSLEQQIRENKVGLVLTGEEQDRVAKVEEALRQGMPASELLFRAAEASDTEAVRAVGKFGMMTQTEALRQVQERGDRSDGDRAAVQYGQMLEQSAAAQLVLMGDSRAVSPDAQRQLAAYARRSDIPESVRNFVGEAARKLEADEEASPQETSSPVEGRRETVIPSGEDISRGTGEDEPGAISAELADRPDAGMIQPQPSEVSLPKQETPVTPKNFPRPSINTVDRTSEGGSDAPSEPEAAAELPSRQAVFGREGIARDDVAAMAKQVEALLSEDTDESVFAAARQLAYLKRAKLGLSEKRKARVFEQLQRHREAFSQKDAVRQARYLTYLKYLGTTEEVTDAEKERIELALVDRTANKQLEGLDQLCVQAKYLGVREDFSSIRPYLQEDMQRKLGTEDLSAQITFARARRKYLGEAYALPQDQLRVEDKVDEQLTTLQAAGTWKQYVQLRMAVDYVRGSAPVPEAVQEGVAQQVAEARERAQETGDWQAYAAYVADAVTLSRRASGASEAPGVRRAADSEVVQFLTALEREHRAKDVQEQAAVAAAPPASTATESQSTAAISREREDAELLGQSDHGKYPQHAAYKQAVAAHEQALRGTQGSDMRRGFIARIRRFFRRGGRPLPEQDTSSKQRAA